MLLATRSLAIVAAALFGAACTSTSSSGSDLDDAERGAEVRILADASGTEATVTVFDAYRRPIALDASEILHVAFQEDDRVLVRGEDARGEPIYRTKLPATIDEPEYRFELVSPSGGTDSLVSGLRLTRPFFLERTPETVQFGQPLEMTFVRTTAATSGTARISLAGPCITAVENASVTVSGGLSEARFDTSLLDVRGSGCAIDVVIEMVSERSLEGTLGRNSASTAVAIRRQTFTTTLVR